MNNQQIKINQQEQKFQKLSQVQSLTLEQLDSVAGGTPSEAYFVRCDRGTMT
ncbi:hypothetical protein [Anabaena sp. UHCC 0399]|uniref:hypothetical protein n=1 Tax=Anabaena sp. UHCC 0399 TaxID=3110238 RepID=UPI002B1FD307|nr:hypothetical protein [Anabaena sp. UHCC 0399]MEA5567330.1 hypothetical protein [Anabaena sp. UHCC 0399]